MSQEEIPDYIGNGLMEIKDLESVKNLTAKMIEMGEDPQSIEFLIRTSYPKGHPLRLNKNKAAKEIFNINGLTAINRTFNTARHLVREILFGKETQAIQQLAQEEIEAEAARPKRPRLPLTEKARAQALKQLSLQFRSENELLKRGRIPSKLKMDYEHFVMDHIDQETQFVLELISNEVPEPEPVV